MDERKRKRKRERGGTHWKENKNPSPRQSKSLLKTGNKINICTWRFFVLCNNCDHTKNEPLQIERHIKPNHQSLNNSKIEGKINTITKRI